MANQPSEVRRNEINVEIGAPCDRVWRALAGDLAQRGGHVHVAIQEPPRHLRLEIGSPLGGAQTLDYRLSPLSDSDTLVVGSVSTRGAWHTIKRLLSFGRIDAAYLHNVAVGLANLQAHLEGRD
jgi:hypothetical protein